MKLIATSDAVGTMLAHDVTQIIPGQYKGAKFKKGHVITHEDIPTLLDMGKEHLYILELSPDDIHEDDAARRLAAAAVGQGVTLTAPDQGKVEFIAACDGLLQVDRDLLMALNNCDKLMLACLHGGQLVKKGQLLGGTRIIPLTISQTMLTESERLCAGGTLLAVAPLKPAKVGLITTGSEIASGRIQDKFGPIVQEKFAALGSTITRQIFPGDDETEITKAIHDLKAEGVDIITLTGGMSVDPDDRTPSAIRKAGAQVLSYGVPVLPGAMFMLAYLDEIPIVGLPGCVMYHKISVFDLIIPRLLAGEKPSRSMLKMLAMGGQCRNCPECHYPNCGFGKI